MQSLGRRVWIIQIQRGWCDLIAQCQRRKYGFQPACSPE
jgi:hypothetical protein